MRTFAATRGYGGSSICPAEAESRALVRRLPWRWAVLALGAAAVGAGIVLTVTGGPLPWSPGGQAAPQARARAYENVNACLLTGARGLADPQTAQVWAGMQQASAATTAQASYVAVTGPATPAEATPFVGTLLVRGCKVIVASGAPERAAALAEAGQFSSVQFVVTGPAAKTPANVTALAFTPSGLQAAVASAVESGIHAEGG